MDFRETNHPEVICSSLAKIIEVSEAERDACRITRPIPKEAYSYKLYFKNKYGVRAHQMVKFR